MGDKAKKGLKQRVAKDSLWNFLASFISRVGGLIFTILLARFLLPEGFGLYSLATSVALMFLTFADLGINQAMIRFVSLEIEKNKKKAAAYFQYILKLKFKLSIILSFMLIVISYPLAQHLFHKPLVFLPFLISGAYIFVLALEGFFESLFYINNKIYYLNIKEVLLQSIRIVFVLFVFLLVAKQFYVSGVITSLVISILLVFIFIIFYSKKFFKFLFEKSETKIDKARVIKFIRYLTLGNLSIVFFSYIDTIMLGLFVSAEYIGYYKAAFNLVLSIAGLLSFVNVLMPVLTKISFVKLSNGFNRIMKYSMMLTIPASFGLIILAKYVIRFVYGDKYLPAAIFLYTLSFMVIISVNVGIISMLFSAREKPEKFAKLTLVATLLNILLNYLFIIIFLRISEFMATMGVAIATLISWMLYFLVALILAKKEFKLEINWTNIIKPLFASFIMFLLIEYIIQKVFDIRLLTGILIVISGIFVYAITLYFIKGLTKEDLEPVKSAILSIFR